MLQIPEAHLHALPAAAHAIAHHALLGREGAVEPTARVLLVDDEQWVLDGLGDRLRGCPFTVVPTTSASTALRLLRQTPIDVIVADQRMPEMNGTELLAAARACSPDTVRIMLTGHASLASAASAINEGGVFRFLLKPCAVDDITGAIADALALRSGGTTRAAVPVVPIERWSRGLRARQRRRHGAWFGAGRGR